MMNEMRCAQRVRRSTLQLPSSWTGVVRGYVATSSRLPAIDAASINQTSSFNTTR